MHNCLNGSLFIVLNYVEITKESVSILLLL